MLLAVHGEAHHFLATVFFQKKRLFMRYLWPILITIAVLAAQSIEFVPDEKSAE